jgi:hypothetical protein
MQHTKDSTRHYSSFQENIQNGNKCEESLVGLNQDLEAFDNLEFKELTLEPILKNGSAKKVTFHKPPPKQTEQPKDASPFDWKGQKGSECQPSQLAPEEIHQGLYCMLHKLPQIHCMLNHQGQVHSQPHQQDSFPYS